MNINNYTMCFVIILYKDDYILVSIDKNNNILLFILANYDKLTTVTLSVMTKS